MQSTIYYYSLG